MLRRWLVPLYLFYAVPMVFFVAINMPVYLMADETNHLMRSETVLHGHIIGKRTDDGRSGGDIDGNMLGLLQIHWPMLSVVDQRMTTEIKQTGQSVHWGGPPVFVDIPNTAIYPPTLYAPVIAGLALGKALDLSMDRTFILARLLNGLVSIALVALALHVAARGRLMIFATMLLPMSVALMASASQDALLLSGAALLVALVTRPIAQQRPATDGEFIAMAALIVALSMSRPTNFAFLLLLLPLAPRLRGRISLLSVAAVSTILVVGWVVLMAAIVQVQQTWGDVVPSMSGQLRHLLAHPFDFFRALYLTLFTGAGYWGTTVMMLGWIGWGQFNITLVPWFYTAALWMLAAALLAEMLSGARSPPRFAALAAGTVLVSAVGIYFIQYLSFSAVGGMEVSGVQGRYFLSLLAAMGLAMPSLAHRLPQPWAGRVRQGLVLGVLLFPLVTMAVLPPTIIARAYMQ